MHLDVSDTTDTGLTGASDPFHRLETLANLLSLAPHLTTFVATGIDIGELAGARTCTMQLAHADKTPCFCCSPICACSITNHRAGACHVHLRHKAAVTLGSPDISRTLQMWSRSSTFSPHAALWSMWIYVGPLPGRTLTWTPPAPHHYCGAGGGLARER